jgi:predicted DNA-binding protein with PD1-like motif
MESLPEDTDLYKGIVGIANNHGVRFGIVTGTGTVKRALLATFDQKWMKVVQAEISQPMEIISMYGEIVASGEGPVPRVHLVLADQNGNGNGGELLPGRTVVHRAQVTIEAAE